MSDYFTHLAMQSMGIASAVRPRRGVAPIEPDYPIATMIAASLARANRPPAQLETDVTTMPELPADAPIAETDGRFPENDFASPQPHAPAPDIFSIRFPSDFSAVPFSDQSIVADVGHAVSVGPPADEQSWPDGTTGPRTPYLALPSPVVPRENATTADLFPSVREIDTSTESPPISKAELELELTFVESFRTSDDSHLIETILPPAPVTQVEGDTPAAVESSSITGPPVAEPQPPSYALARIKQVRTALFGLTKPSNESAPVSIQHPEPAFQ